MIGLEGVIRIAGILPLLSPPARQNFFSLFETVTGHRARKVVITSRGSENHAVLVGESYFNELEAAAKRLRDIESGKAKPASEVLGLNSLRGSSVSRFGAAAYRETRTAASTLWSAFIRSRQGMPTRRGCGIINP